MVVFAVFELLSITSVDGAFFVCFIHYITSFRAEVLSEAKKSIKETNNTPFHARSGNEPVRRIWEPSSTIKNIKSLLDISPVKLLHFFKNCVKSNTDCSKGAKNMEMTQ